MTHQQASFRRKVIYLSAMALLLLPLSIWGLPAKSQATFRDRQQQSWWQVLQGGRVLANLRYQYKLAQGNLGEIDPASEAFKFGTFGLKGVVATQLWEKSDEYKKKENWTELSNVIDQLSKLQPNFVGVWRFQGWNLSFNVSAEQDDYRWRYYWVIKGIDYLDQGQKYNDRESRLYWDEGWFTGHKIGRADEFRQFRRLFRTREMADQIDVPPPRRQLPERDHWLYAKEIFLEALDLHENKSAPLRGMSEELYFSEPAKCQMRFTEAGNDEGRFGEWSRYNWEQAKNEWIAFGQRPFASQQGGVLVRIDDLEADQAEFVRVLDELELVGGVDEQKRTLRQQLVAKKKEALTPRERALLEKDADKLADDERREAFAIHRRSVVSHEEILDAMPLDRRVKAEELAARMTELQMRMHYIGAKRQMVNYPYWKMRCIAEASELGIDASESLYKAREAYRINHTKAKGPYEAAFKKWRAIYDKYPILLGDASKGDDMVEEIRRYARVLELYNEKFDQAKFILKDVIEARQPDQPIGE
jgi:hypothetical protein